MFVETNGAAKGSDAGETSPIFGVQARVKLSFPVKAWLCASRPQSPAESRLRTTSYAAFESSTRVEGLCPLETSSAARSLTFPRFGARSPTPMLHLLYALLATARSSLRSQRELALENFALRQQLAVLKHETKRPRLINADRAFWVVLSRLWTDWQHALILVKPETVIGWHCKGFKLYWTWKSQNRGGRPRIDAEIRSLIRRMARENPTWGAPRIHGELLKLGFKASEATVSRYMPRRRKPPSQNWRTFLQNHAKDLVSVDFFVVPTATSASCTSSSCSSTIADASCTSTSLRGHPLDGQVSNW